MSLRKKEYCQKPLLATLKLIKLLMINSSAMRSPRCAASAVFSHREQEAWRLNYRLDLFYWFGFGRGGSSGYMEDSFHVSLPTSLKKQLVLSLVSNVNKIICQSHH